MDKVLISTDKLSKVYGTENPVEVLHEIDINIKEQDFASIIGPSGSGKTTLLNILGTLDEPTNGRILFKGEDLSKKSSKDLSLFRNKNMGFVFQFHHLLEGFTALENVLIPSWIESGRPTNKKESHAKALLEMVGLEKAIHKKVGNLSGGQQQRVAIARSLINSPEIVFGDEPTGNLDVENTEAVYQLLRKIHQEVKTAFLIVTHDMNLAKKCDRVIEMVDGKIDKDMVIQ